MPGERIHRPTAAREGFSLVELLVVVVMLALIVSAVMSLYVGGLRVWSRIDAYDAPGLSGMHAMASVRKDLMNQYPDHTQSWSGESDLMTFPVLERGRQMGATNFLTMVEYAYDRQKGRLLRTSRRFDNRGQQDEIIEELGENVSDVTFEFAAKPLAGEKDLDWETSWKDRRDRPAAVRVEILLEDHAPLRREIIMRTGL